MKAGELRDRIHYLRLLRTPDGAGGYSDRWDPQIAVWGKVKTGATTYGAGKELVKAAKSDPTKVFLITHRYTLGVEESMRATWRGKTLEIVAVLYPTGKKDEMQVLTKEVGLNV